MRHDLKKYKVKTNTKRQKLRMWLTGFDSQNGRAKYTTSILPQNAVLAKELAHS